MSRNFRNEGIDATHNPEFTMLEYYEAYSDADEQMAFAEKTIKTVVKKILKSGSIGYESGNIDFKKIYGGVVL